MNDRQRAYKSLHWDHPDSLVVETWISPATWQKYRQDLEPVMQRMPDDFTPYPGPRPNYDEMPPTYRQGDIYTDPWGCAWECRLDGMQGIITDDWGEQNRLMVSPAAWREYFSAGYREMFAAVKGQGRAVYFHTDGYLLPVVPDLIGAGADAINLQSRLNGLAGIRSAYLGKVTVSVDLDRQSILPWGAPDAVKDHVREIYTTLEGWNGGLWVKAGIFPDTPLENIIAPCEVFEELRR